MSSYASLYDNPYVREALLYTDLMDSQRVLSDEMGIAWHDCSTVVSISAKLPQHVPMPAWINPYDARILEDPETLKRWRRQGKTPTTMYQQRINVLALRLTGKTWDDMKTPDDWRTFRTAKEQAVKLLRGDLRSFLTGFTDCHCNFWCGQCYSRCQFIDIGHDLDYPMLWVSHTERGYAAWFFTACYDGLVALEDGLRLAKRIKAERPARVEVLA